MSMISHEDLTYGVQVMFVTSYNRFPGRDRESSFHEYENSEEKPLLEHRQHPEA